MEDKSLARLAEIRQQEKERLARLEEMKKEEERLLQEFKRLSTKYPSHPLVSINKDTLCSFLCMSACSCNIYIHPKSYLCKLIMSSFC